MNNKGIAIAFSKVIASEGLCCFAGIKCAQCPLNYGCKEEYTTKVGYLERKTNLMQQWLIEHAEDSLEALL